MRGKRNFAIFFGSIITAAICAAIPSAACAADASSTGAELTDPGALARKLKSQQNELDQQRRDIAALRAQLRSLLAQTHRAPVTQAAVKPVRPEPAHQSVVRAAATPARGASGVQAVPAVLEPQNNDSVDAQVELLEAGLLGSVRAGQAQTGSGAMPNQPVGEQPQAPKQLPDATALPEEANLLTPPGSFILTPTVEYTRASTNVLVFRGIAIVPGIQFGLVNASTSQQDTAIVTADLRAGVLDRLELELRVPFVARGLSEQELNQQTVAQNAPATITTNLNGKGLGDVEGSLRYQINGDVQQDDPVYIVSLRVKSNTGIGPFNVNFGASGIASALPTGTGFWAIGPGFLVLVPSDPAVLYVNVSYLHSFGYNVNKVIDTTLVGQVSPGDSAEIGLGFGLAVNPKFSFSLGYNHTAILPTTQFLGSGNPIKLTKTRSLTLQAGQLSLGASYSVSPDFVINTQFLFGVTPDAPNMDVTFRIPMNI